MAGPDIGEGSKIIKPAVPAAKSTTSFLGRDIKVLKPMDMFGTSITPSRVETQIVEESSPESPPQAAEPPVLPAVGGLPQDLVDAVRAEVGEQGRQPGRVRRFLGGLRSHGTAPAPTTEIQAEGYQPPPIPVAIESPDVIPPPEKVLTAEERRAVLEGIANRQGGVNEAWSEVVRKQAEARAAVVPSATALAIPDEQSGAAVAGSGGKLGEWLRQTAEKNAAEARRSEGEGSNVLPEEPAGEVGEQQGRVRRERIRPPAVQSKESKEIDRLIRETQDAQRAKENPVEPPEVVSPPVEEIPEEEFNPLGSLLGDIVLAPPREVETPEDKQVRRLFVDVRIREGIADAFRKLTRRNPSKEQVDVIAKDAQKRVSKVKALGQALPNFITGAVLGGGTKTVALTGFSIVGMGGLPFTAGAGALGGAMRGFYKEYRNQRKAGIEIGEVAEARGKIKREWARFSASNKKKIAFAAGRGAVAGALGATAGAAVVGAVASGLEQYVNLSGIVHNIPGVSHLSGVRNLPVVRNIPGVGSGHGSPDVTHVAGTPTPIPEGIPGAGGAENVAPSLMDMPPGDIVKSALPEGINLPTGSDPWDAVRGQLTQALGGNPTDDQLRDGVARFLSQNGIVDATQIPAGTHLSMEAVNQLAGEILGSHQLLPADIASLPDKLPLPTGSDIWKQSSKLVADHLGREPKPFEILGIAKALAESSHVAVPAWGIPGSIDSHNLPAGFVLTLNDEVKRKMAAVLVK